jgi:hypothetical protein
MAVTPWPPAAGSRSSNTGSGVTALDSSAVVLPVLACLLVLVEGVVGVGESVVGAVVITGAIHSSWVNDLEADFLDPASRTIATEFVGTSVSSNFPVS